MHSAFGHFLVLFLGARHAELGPTIILIGFVLALPCLFLGVVEERIHELVVLLAAVVKVSVKAIGVLEVLDPQLRHVVQRRVLSPVDEVALVLLHLLVQGQRRARVQLLSDLGLLGLLFLVLEIIRLSLSLFSSLRGCHRACGVLRCGLLSSDGLFVELVIDLAPCLLQSYNVFFVLDTYQSVLEALSVLVKLLLSLIVDDLVLTTSHLRILDP